MISLLMEGQSCLPGFAVGINISLCVGVCARVHVCVCISMCVWSLIAITKHSQHAPSYIMSSDKYFTFRLSNIYSAPSPSWVYRMQPHCSSPDLILSQCEIPFQRFVKVGSSCVEGWIKKKKEKKKTSSAKKASHLWRRLTALSHFSEAAPTNESF